MCADAEQAIKLFGTDFSLMEKMFPGRQRKALKFKLRREYKDNQERIDAALSGKDCDAGSYQEVVNALHKVRQRSWTNRKTAKKQKTPSKMHPADGVRAGSCCKA